MSVFLGMSAIHAIGLLEQEAIERKFQETTARLFSPKGTGSAMKILDVRFRLWPREPLESIQLCKATS